MLEQDRAMLAGRGGPAPALTLGISDGKLFQSPNEAGRESAFALARSTGATVARISADWRSIAPVDPSAGFAPRDPGDPGYDFAPLDAAVRSAAVAGLEPLLVVSHAPAFAEAPGRWPYAYAGSWDPDPAALEAFATALARRYDGSYPDPSDPDRTLPRVRLWQAWNEPNLSRYLAPQWVVRGGRWSAFSPLLYRQLLDGFYNGVKSVAPGDLVAAAGVAPNGDRTGVGRMAPLTFLRSTLCLQPGARGHLRRTPGCGSPVELDALAFHPLSIGDPNRPASSSLDVSVADAGKVAGLDRAAVQLSTVAPAGTKPLWVTELNWESAPQVPGGVAPALQAAWLSRALHRLWTAGVSLVAWQFLIDPFPALTLAGPDGRPVSYARPAGLYAPGSGGDGEPVAKPFVAAFRFPFDPLRVDRGHVRLWGLAPTGSGPIELEAARPGRSWRVVGRVHTSRGRAIDALVRLRGKLALRLSARGLRSPTSQVGTGRALRGSG